MWEAVLPMFLFRVGLLTLMNMASLMVLAILFSSLPRILKLSIDVIWPLAVWWWKNWRRCLHMLLESLSQGSPRLSHIFFITAKLTTAVTVDNTTLVSHLILIFWWHEYVLQCSVFLWNNSYAIFSANVFHTLTNSWCVRNDDVAPLCRFVGFFWASVSYSFLNWCCLNISWWPNWDTCNGQVLLPDVSILFPDVLELSRWCVLCVSGS